GAKSIILDLEFRVPRDKPGDTALAHAIQNAGNVYLASVAELPLAEYKDRRHRQDTRHQADRNAVYMYYLVPYLQQQGVLANLYPTPVLSSNVLGINAPFPVSQYLNLPPQALILPWQARLNTSLNRTTFIQSPLNPPSPNTVTDEILTQECLKGNYHQTYRQQPQYLDILNRQKLQATVYQSSSVQDQTSYCVLSPVVHDFIRNAKGVGITSVEYESDAFIREVPALYQGYQGNAYTHLGIRPALDLLAPIGLMYSDTQMTIDQQQFPSKHIPLNKNGRMLINWRNPALLAKNLYQQAGYSLPPDSLRQISSDKGNPELGYGHLYRLVSVVDLLQQIQSSNQTSPADRPSLYNLYGQPQTGLLSFKDKIVIYGDAIKDLHRTPVGNTVFGPEVVATILDMVWQDDTFIHRAPVWQWSLLTLLFCAALAASLLIPKRVVAGYILALILFGLYWAGNFWLFVSQALWLPLVTPSLFMSAALASSLVYRFKVQDKEKRQLTQVFSKYVSPQIMDSILENPDSAMEKLAGTKKELTVLFSDLQGFTPYMETEDMTRAIEQLNEFFTVMTRIILKHQGTYDKYMGDAIMAFFGAPVDVPDHAEKACRAAVEMTEALKMLNEKWTQEGFRELGIGIGISTGDMVVGNFGSEDIKDFTVMGSAVNLGARLESSTRAVKAQIVISEKTYLQAQKGIQAISVGEEGLTLKGFSENVPAYILNGVNKPS
ncbi:MAG: CHASE2 domain-containing protein, partial [Vampirovibrio sp.]|nr:CHASE2 domain-containing protein [Vampirovibrio sp.]